MEQKYHYDPYNPITPPPPPGSPNPYGFDPNMMPQQELPNATLILVLGILSIPFCCACGSGLVFGIIALVMANKARELYNANPQAYTAKSLGNVNAGRIVAIVGIVLSALQIIYYIVIMIFKGMEGIMHPSYLR